MKNQKALKVAWALEDMIKMKRMGLIKKIAAEDYGSVAVISGFCDGLGHALWTLQMEFNLDLNEERG